MGNFIDLPFAWFNFAPLVYNKPILVLKLVLASKSPRRHQLLKAMGYDFEIRTADTDESFPADMPAMEVAPYLALKKADALLHTLQADELLITSDTTVVLHGEIYNKPEDYDDAVRILGNLSGNMHEVVTGVCLATRESKKVFHEIAKVYFKPISTESIHYYIEHYQPYDKAGAYAIQEWIGLTHIARIDGSYSNIMGLPTERLYDELTAFLGNANAR